MSSLKFAKLWVGLDNSTNDPTISPSAVLPHAIREDTFAEMTCNNNHNESNLLRIQLTSTFNNLNRSVWPKMKTSKATAQHTLKPFYRSFQDWNCLGSNNFHRVTADPSHPSSEELGR